MPWKINGHNTEQGQMVTYSQPNAPGQEFQELLTVYSLEQLFKYYLIELGNFNEMPLNIRTMGCLATSSKYIVVVATNDGDRI